MKHGDRTASLAAVDFSIFHSKGFFMHLRSLLVLAAALVVGTVAHAHEYTLGDLHIEHPYARPTVPMQRSGGAYLVIENKGKDADKLVAASSPIAQSVQIHTMSMEGDVMKMREVDSVELKPASKIEMTPGHGYHLMMLGLHQPLKAGDKFPLTLTFEKAGKTEVSVVVGEPNAMQSDKKSMPMSMH
jgi:periplasmic copper chaperone A